MLHGFHPARIVWSPRVPSFGMLGNTMSACVLQRLFASILGRLGVSVNDPWVDSSAQSSLRAFAASPTPLSSFVPRGRSLGDPPRPVPAPRRRPAAVAAAISPPHAESKHPPPRPHAESKHPPPRPSVRRRPAAAPSSVPSDAAASHAPLPAPLLRSPLPFLHLSLATSSLRISSTLIFSWFFGEEAATSQVFDWVSFRAGVDRAIRDSSGHFLRFVSVSFSFRGVSVNLTFGNRHFVSTVSVASSPRLWPGRGPLFSTPNPRTPCRDVSPSIGIGIGNSSGSRAPPLPSPTLLPIPPDGNVLSLVPPFYISPSGPWASLASPSSASLAHSSAAADALPAAGADPPSALVHVTPCGACAPRSSFARAVPSGCSSLPSGGARVPIRRAARSAPSAPSAVPPVPPIVAALRASAVVRSAPAAASAIPPVSSVADASRAAAAVPASSFPSLGLLPSSSQHDS